MRRCEWPARGGSGSVSREGVGFFFGANLVARARERPYFLPCSAGSAGSAALFLVCLLRCFASQVSALSGGADELD